MPGPGRPTIRSRAVPRSPCWEQDRKSVSLPGPPHLPVCEATHLETDRPRRFLRRLALEPGHAGAHLGLADCAERARDWARASAHLDLAVGCDPRTVAARLRLADARARAGLPARLASLVRVAALVPRDPRPTTRLATALEAAARPHDAEAMARQAVAVDPLWRPGWRALATARFRQGRLADAARGFARAWRCDPRDVDDHLNEGLARRRAGQSTAAVTAYRRAAALDPARRTALQGLRDLFFARGRLGAAIRAARAAEADGEGTRVVPVRVAPPAVAGGDGAIEYRSLSLPRRVRITVGGRPVDYAVPGLFAARVDGAVALPPGFAVVTPSGALLVDRVAPYLRDDLRRLGSFLCAAAADRLLLRLSERPVVVEGDAVLLGGDGSLSHWLTDGLSRMLAMEAIGRTTDTRTLPVIVARRTPPPIRELLSQLGIGAGRWRGVPDDRPISVDRLWVPSLAHRYGRMSPDYVRWLRDVLSVPGRAATDGRRVLLARDGGVPSPLARLGVEAVDPDALDLAGWRRLGGACGIVLGETGDILAASLTMPPGTVIVELASAAPGSRPASAATAGAQLLQAALLRQHHARIATTGRVTAESVAVMAERLAAVVAAGAARVGTAPETRVEELPGA